MPNYTIEDYKNAIKKKYEVEKRGEYSNHFNPPSNINLKNLCIKRYKSDSSKNDIDLDIFFSFFGFAFDPARRNLFNDSLDKFKNVRSFLTGKTISPKDETIHFSAVLVDFHPRPLNKFLLEWNGDQNPIDSSNDCTPLGSPEGEKNIDSTSHNEVKRVKIKTESFDILGRFKEKFSYKFIGRLKKTSIGVLIALCLGFAVSYYAFPKRECMIWVNDHYDKYSVSSDEYCDNYYDPRYFNLKKIKVCDTTTFFKNGKPVVFYSKSGDSIECFNQFAPHPERPTQYLRPITRYMIGEYLQNKPCK